jgi:type II secretory pathway component PulF
VAVADLRQHIYQRFAYLATVSVMLVTVLTFVMIKIVPSYQEIFEDFDLQITPVTQGFIAFSESVGVLLGIPILLTFVALTLGAAIIGILYLCDFPILQPVFDYIGVAQHQAHVLRLLAAWIARGAPLSKALAELEDGRFGYPSPLIRRRLGDARRRILGGHEWTEALRRSALISASDAATLRTAQEVGNLPWAMRLIADRKLRLMAFRWSVIENVLFTAVILALGLVVFWYAVAMFYPITRLIWSLTP